MPRLEEMGGEMRRAERNQKDDDHCSRQRQSYGEAAGMFWPKIIDQAHDQQHSNRRERDMVTRHPDPFDVFRAGGDIGKG